ncbi:DEAD-domain-containing protein [Tilletiaria anomala UBC 951]|uniref:ATP-dependent RNA helicase n=1 Tax=Tilletiaria anomala (strain ATCC 24038 / CBS 436.72 / UBC 951) TaxID=1037660 RepID=A0A066VDM2_TILAU|nr:DEAD-domain-containing protein [Tilletiaria anomala UBC 951]KDN38378.1 DEAD-domain-containing protein [Tilletiaria anomala UBC 951]
MDDDDGILLNFSVPAQASANGSNKKRKQVTSSRPSQRNSSSRTAELHVSRDHLARAPKKAKLIPHPAVSRTYRAVSTGLVPKTGGSSSRSATTSASSKDGHAKKEEVPVASAGHAQPSLNAGTGGTVISSLFTGVSIPRAKPSSTAKNALAHAPSNAPLSGPVTFSTLGLHPLLVQYLKSEKIGIGERPTDIQKKALPHLFAVGQYTLDGDDVPLSQSKRRDVLLASQTGSGKTLSFLLPILHSLLPLSSLSFIHRSITGTLAIILTPTRELARQIYEVLEKLVNLPLRLQGSSEAEGQGDDGDDGPRMSRWIVPTLLCGGSTKNHEKTRLRKGSSIVVATPGRLLDHLQNTSAFDVGKLRWLVLDEADRLMELGFKETLEGIVKAIDGRRKLAMEAAREATRAREGLPASASASAVPKDDAEELDYMGVNWWAGGRRTILCSATIDENVQILAGSTLRDPLVVRGHGGKEPEQVSVQEKSEKSDASQLAEASNSLATTASSGTFAAPAQLRQHYLLVPPKLRLVTLIALLRQVLFSKQRPDGREGANRVIVFMSCTDSVDFHWNGVGGMTMDGSADSEEREEVEAGHKEQVAQRCELLPGCSFYRLHGSLQQGERIASLRAFSSLGEKKAKRGSKEGATDAEEGAPAPAEETGDQGKNSAAVLFCTSVASRGLDLPHVGTVIQLDAPTEGGVEEYVHRIGRTARVGKAGHSWTMLLPHEKPIVEKYQAGMFIDDQQGQSSSAARPGDKRQRPQINEVDFRDVLLEGYGGTADEYENRATDVQLAFERWVLRSEKAVSLARQAYLSHLRAYATHPSSEKAIFSLRDVHLGHLAKAFALREAPATVKSKARLAHLQQDSGEGTTAKRKKAKMAKAASAGTNGPADDGSSDGEEKDGLMKGKAKLASKADMLALASKIGETSGGGADAGVNSIMVRNKEAEERMYAAVRQLGKKSKKKGQMGAMGADEFQIV